MVETAAVVAAADEHPLYLHMVEIAMLAFVAGFVAFDIAEIPFDCD